MFNDWKLKKWIKDTNNPNPEKRLAAFQSIERFAEEDDTFSQSILYDMVNAAIRTHQPVAEWDVPGYQLLKFAHSYNHPELAYEVLKVFSHLPKEAKPIAVDILCDIGDEKCVNGLYELLEEELQISNLDPYLNSLQKVPFVIVKLVDKNLKKLEEPIHKHSFYRLLLQCVSNEYIRPINKNYVIPVLLEDYKLKKQDYLAFNESYKTKYVYTSWKNNYIDIRNDMFTYLSLMEYYFSDETKELLTESLYFKDPILASNASIVCLQRNIDVGEDVLQFCSKHIESSVYFYDSLTSMRKEHLFSPGGKKQPLFAKTHLFYHLIHNKEYGRFPDDISIEKTVDTENYYKQPIRCYIASFQSEDDEKYVALVGGYNLEAGEDESYMWDRTKTDFEPFDSKSLDQHVHKLVIEEQEKREESLKEIIYEGRPNWGKGSILIFWFAVYFSYRTIFHHMDEGLTIIFLGLLIIKVISKTKERRDHTVKLDHTNVIFEAKGNRVVVGQEKLKRVVIEKKRKKMVVLYDKKDRVIMSFPKAYVNYDVFHRALRQTTEHLAEPPYIEQ
ncbi:hypothetical protein QTG56_25535 (plasmid) [Rossellomorea sp. AcN35-11]|nr:hypothetical protein [Rossellomorea aquimaris]WJV31978.1 hypothetical protein QTG56_25535 [Rossellomorea sp. AcN35-11]